MAVRITPHLQQGAFRTLGSGEVYAFHPGGANVAYGDGSVHFINENILVNVFAALVTRDGGEMCRRNRIVRAVALNARLPNRSSAPLVQARQSAPRGVDIPVPSARNAGCIDGPRRSKTSVGGGRHAAPFV